MSWRMTVGGGMGFRGEGKCEMSMIRLCATEWQKKARRRTGLKETVTKAVGETLASSPQEGNVSKGHGSVQAVGGDELGGDGADLRAGDPVSRHNIDKLEEKALGWGPRCVSGT